jgi:hypothetical protein
MFKFFIIFSAFITTALFSKNAVAYYALDNEICLFETAKREKIDNIKEHLLSSLALVESGKWDKIKKEKIAWPWTINVEGKSMVFDSKSEAVNAVKTFQKQGVKSIDIGCMQINLKHHSDAFLTLEEGFEPAKNIEYAAKFLKNLYEQNGSWLVALKKYHSSTPEKGLYYATKVLPEFVNIADKIDAENQNYSPKVALNEPEEHKINIENTAQIKKENTPPPKGFKFVNEAEKKSSTILISSAEIDNNKKIIEAQKVTVMQDKINSDFIKRENAKQKAKEWRMAKLASYMNGRNARLVGIMKNKKENNNAF